MASCDEVSVEVFGQILLLSNFFFIQTSIEDLVKVRNVEPRQDRLNEIVVRGLKEKQCNLSPLL